MDNSEIERLYSEIRSLRALLATKETESQQLEQRIKSLMSEIELCGRGSSRLT